MYAYKCKHNFSHALDIPNVCACATCFFMCVCVHVFRYKHAGEIEDRQVFFCYNFANIMYTYSYCDHHEFVQESEYNTCRKFDGF